LRPDFGAASPDCGFGVVCSVVGADPGDFKPVFGAAKPVAGALIPGDASFGAASLVVDCGTT
jgi:hypothetical protein